MAHKPTMLDGALGTSLWAKTNDKSPVWMFNITHPDLLAEHYKEMIAAGSQFVYTNTFEANRLSLSHFSYGVQEVIEAGMKIAFEAAKPAALPIALSIGPLPELLEPYGDLEEDECASVFREMLDAAITGPYPPDCIIFETFMDLEMMRVAVQAAKPYGLPIWCSFTFEQAGRTMMGNSVEDIVTALEPEGVYALGMNCGLGPQAALPIMQQYKAHTTLPLFAKPNAGKPKVSTGSDAAACPYTAESFAQEMSALLPYVDYVGGCCGCDTSYIAALKKLIDEA